MIEKKFVQVKKGEFILKEFIKQGLGKGKISSTSIERTPVGEKITVRTSKPGLVIGRRGEKIADLTEVLKNRFKLENPHIEIVEIKHPYLDAWSVADEIALALEHSGPVRFKTIAYKMLEQIKKAGALGAEIRLSGKLPSERAKSWRFAFGLLKKTGDTAKIVARAKIPAQTIPGVIGIKVEIMPPDAYTQLASAELSKNVTLIKQLSNVKIEKEIENKVETKREKKVLSKDSKKDDKIILNSYRNLIK